MRAMTRGLAWGEAALLAQQGHLFPWVPVALAFGIGVYFSLLSEPGTAVFAGLAVVAAVCAAMALWRPGGWAAIGWAVALVSVGVCLAGIRTATVAEPVLGWRYYGPVEGRIVALDRSASGAVRVTLDEVELKKLPPHRRPARVRVSLYGSFGTLKPGQRVSTTANLAPPQGPAEPGGFDFRRHAWFQGLGAVGYTRKPLVITAPAQGGSPGLRITRLRYAISAHIRSVLDGDTAGFAAAVTTGDRSGISKQALQDLRDSNLAHLLAISGLHMGLLSGFVFAALRIAIALIPPLALRVPGKKLAAVMSLVAAALYLGLSGGNVATERAFVMVSVLLVAVLVERRAFSLRAVALAALVILVMRPEALFGPGFQMSFAATTALIAVFGLIRDADLPRAPKWLRSVLGVVISSAVAGAATAPIGAAHFNTLSHFGLVANLLAVPVMGVIVVPSAVLTLLLAPLGLDHVGLHLMGGGLDWILRVAGWVAQLEGAKGFVKTPDPTVLPVFAAGMLWLILWQGGARLVGPVIVAVAFAGWAQSERPAVLIAANGSLVGVMTPQGRALSKERGAGFVAGIWLENDGDGADQAAAAARWPDSPHARIRVFDTAYGQIVHLIGKKAVGKWSDCDNGQIVVASVPFPVLGDCRVYDLDTLRDTGSVSIGPDGIRTARRDSGVRPWSGNRP